MLLLLTGLLWTLIWRQKTSRTYFCSSLPRFSEWISELHRYFLEGITHAWVSSLISFVYIWTKVLINSIQLPIVKLAGPDPTIGRMMTLPLTLYFPTSDNSWALTWSSNLDVVGSLPNPLFEKLIISFCYWQRWTHNRPFTYTTLFTTMLLRP